MKLRNIKSLKIVLAAIWLCFVVMVLALLSSDILVNVSNKNKVIFTKISDTVYTAVSDKASLGDFAFIRIPLSKTDYELYVNGIMIKKFYLGNEPFIPPSTSTFYTIEESIKIEIRFEKEDLSFSANTIVVETYDSAYIKSCIYVVSCFFLIAFLISVILFLAGFYKIKNNSRQFLYLCIVSGFFIVRVCSHMLFYSNSYSFSLFDEKELLLPYGLIYKIMAISAQLAMFFILEYYNFVLWFERKKVIIIQRIIYISVVIISLCIPSDILRQLSFIPILLTASSLIYIMVLSTKDLIVSNRKRPLEFIGMVIIVAFNIVDGTASLQGKSTSIALFGFFIFCAFILFDIMKEFLGFQRSFEYLTTRLEDEVKKRTNELLSANISLKKEIEARKITEETLLITSKTDFLTGAYNRMEGQRYIDEHIKIYNRYNQPFCVVLLDIDNFKQVNDKYGHNTGDVTLVTISSELSRIVRNTDMLARWGGEEFIIIMPNTTLHNAIIVADKLRQKTSDLVIDGPQTVTISLGVAEISPNEDANILIKRADDNLYKAKSSGKNCVYPRLSKK